MQLVTPERYYRTVVEFVDAVELKEDVQTNENGKLRVYEAGDFIVANKNTGQQEFTERNKFLANYKKLNDAVISLK